VLHQGECGSQQRCSVATGEAGQENDLVTALRTSDGLDGGGSQNLSVGEP
jgi:hypothetical protein